MRTLNNSIMGFLLILAFVSLSLAYMFFIISENSKSEARMYNSLHNRLADSIFYYKNKNGEIIAKMSSAELSLKELYNSSNKEIVSLKKRIREFEVRDNDVERYTEVTVKTKDSIVIHIDSMKIKILANDTFKFEDQYLKSIISVDTNYNVKMNYEIQEDLSILYSLDRMPKYEGENKFRIWWNTTKVGYVLCRKKTVPHIQAKSSNPNTKIIKLDSYSLTK